MCLKIIILQFLTPTGLEAILYNKNKKITIKIHKYLIDLNKIKIIKIQYKIKVKLPNIIKGLNLKNKIFNNRLKEGRI